MDVEAMPKSFANHHTWYQSMLSSLSPTPSHPSKLLYSYSHAIQGFSATLTDSEIQALKETLAYLHSTKESPVDRDTTHTPNFLGLNPIFGTWPASTFGKDVVIGVIDSGVWPESKSFSDHGLAPVPSKWKGWCESGTKFKASMCNKKLIGAQSFNKGLLAKHPRVKISMNSPRNTDGHGTHTSSTAAGSPVDNASFFGYANGTATEMASHARVAMYKVFWDEGESVADIIAAMDKAISDGVDVLSMSLGLNAAKLLDDPVAVATFAAVQKGIFVSLSAGNALPFLHNGTPWALTVAAGTVDRRFGGTITLGSGVKVKGDSLWLNGTTPKNASMLFIKCDEGKTVEAVPSHTVVVCLALEETALVEQVEMLYQFTVSGAIFITRSAHTDLYLDTSYPSIFLDLEAGKTVMDYINRRSIKARVTFNFQKTWIGSMVVAPKVAYYSARDPSPTCPFILKPDLMAPVAFAGSSSFYNDFNIISGTSMACPHAVGVAALVKGAHPSGLRR